MIRSRGVWCGVLCAVLCLLERLDSGLIYVCDITRYRLEKKRGRVVGCGGRCVVCCVFSSD